MQGKGFAISLPFNPHNAHGLIKLDMRPRTYLERDGAASPPSAIGEKIECVPSAWQAARSVRGDSAVPPGERADADKKLMQDKMAAR